ncbi:hypothetical protein KUCAC02_008709 [Chaenocephalus aceratus]|uniref:Uncharacterized protein n=1 Tax=Chaenocephalus aceratus TaxID=36190 RepID=A0ACB9WS43_CHAAC|nr:hypothetical protein KUCAC02_008709 [Chaenocephalus aceratus]
MPGLLVSVGPCRSAPKDSAQRISVCSCERERTLQYSTPPEITLGVFCLPRPARVRGRHVSSDVKIAVVCFESMLFSKAETDSIRSCVSAAGLLERFTSLEKNGLGASNCDDV